MFWLALLTCSRIGNLSGLTVMGVEPEAVTILNAAHKTYSDIGTRTLRLAYWNPAMRKSIVSGMNVGPVTKDDESRMKSMLSSLKIQQHSVRRTGVQVYLGARVPEDRIRAITLHSGTEMLLSYADIFEPVLDIRRSTGLASSLAPYIVSIQRANHVPIY